MSKPYQHPVPDFSTALPPKNGVGLSIPSALIVDLFKRYLGRPFTATMVLQALKEDFNIWDNHVAAVTALVTLAARGKIWPAAYVVAGGRQFAAWMIPAPDVPDERAAP